MRRSATKIYHWGIEKASSDRAPLWLTLLFGLELVLFIPLDAILVFFCLQKRSSILLYVLLAALASTVSGFVGYLLGHFLWDLIGNWVVPHFVSLQLFAKIAFHLQEYEVWALFLGALLPFPLKALSLVAGVFQLGILPFLSYLFLARLIRFGLIGLSMALFGGKVKTFLDRHFHRIFLFFGVKFAAALLFFWVLAK